MFILAHNNSIASHYISDLRDIHVQQDRMRFRRNMERIGEILAYEISKTMVFQHVSVQTPLAEASVKKMTEQPILISILRAGLPFYQGFLNVFDHADSGFLGAYRKPETNDEIEIDFLYKAAPAIADKDIIVIDPMLATGKSILTSIEHLLANGTPRMVHIASAIAAPEGIAYLEQNLKVPFRFWLGALDQNLNSHAYIIPGLGDAGDLCFGPKL